MIGIVSDRDTGNSFYARANRPLALAGEFSLGGLLSSKDEGPWPPAVVQAFRSTTARSRPQRGPGRRTQDRAGRATQPADDQQLVDELALVRRTIVGRGRRQRRLRRVAARASPRFQVPPFVAIAARGRVVSGEPGGAAVRGAGAGVAKAADWRLGVRAAAPALLQHRHAWSVPTAEQAKPCLPCHAQGRRHRPVVGGLRPAMLQAIGQLD